MIRIVLSVALSLLVIPLKSQSLIKQKVKKPAPVKTKEIFQVLKNEPSIKQGWYKKYKYNKLIEEGYYNNNKKDSIWKYYNQSGPLVASGKFKEDSMVGVWHYYSYQKSLLQTYNHDVDSLTCYNTHEERKTGSNTIICHDTGALQAPLFIGGDYYMNTLIENNTIYPKQAWFMLKTAKVVVSFIVDTNGYTKKVESIKPAGYGFDEEAIRLIEDFGQAWIPAKENGKRVAFKYSIMLTFKLD